MCSVSDYCKPWGAWRIPWYMDDRSGCTEASSHTHTHTHPPTHPGLHVHHNVSSSCVKRGVFPAARLLKIFHWNHSQHSNLCLACVSMLFGWSAELPISAHWWHHFCWSCVWSAAREFTHLLTTARRISELLEFVRTTGHASAIVILKKWVAVLMSATKVYEILRKRKGVILF